MLDFNPHAPRGARQDDPPVQLDGVPFQSTRPSRGATPRPGYGEGGAKDFNPRAPRGARRLRDGNGIAGTGFQSTRPSRGATAGRLSAGSSHWHFNPRAPRGARLCRAGPDSVGSSISIHAPLAGRDPPRSPAPRCQQTDFNPRAPRGARLIVDGAPCEWKQFQSTRPSRGATANVHKNHVHICANTQKKYVFLSNTVCQSA